jgi:Protein of unknown function (DUF1598)
MVCTRNTRCGQIAIAISLCCLTAILASTRSAFAADPDAKVQEHLAAGEFGPALASAGAVADPARRDQLLNDVAAAQSSAGARRAAIETAYDISSDLRRKAALDRVSGSGGVSGQAGGARGGGVIADFDSLIDLITTTVSPQSWDEVGGPGSVSSFQGGVFVDPTGLLKKLPPQTDRSLIAVRREALAATYSGDPRRKSSLRKISLTRLEREVQLLHALGREPDETMRTLAGLMRIKYLLIYPETGDIVLAGPAGPCRRDAEGRVVDAEKGRPIVNLDDLVVTLRNAYSETGRFGCSIVPRKDNLAAAQAVNDKWSRQALRPGQRDKWLGEFRDAVGRQDITVHGISPQTRAARVIVEADYRMKLVGLGLEEGTVGVQSYLDTIQLGPDGKPPPMSVLRWWFTLNYDALTATDGRDAFELRGPGVKVQSENEMVTAQGDRVHTGGSDEPTSRFAESFTKHFEALAAKYPVYADLRNIFDLSLVAAVIHSHDVPEQVGWHMTHFGPGGEYVPELGVGPSEVESVVNHKLINGKHIVAAVSGGVAVDARALGSRQAIKTDTSGQAATYRANSAPAELPRRAWWWD